MKTSLVIHGHFYQPPRENPWTGQMDREPSAHPDHDWNAKIHRECYRANAFARILDPFGRVEKIFNNYAHMSFNFGPTLLSWIEANDPDSYQRILDADQESAKENHGHGSAIAQGYNHAILPLCNERDRKTQIRWGLEDFKYRFGRDAESLWLPETAANDATLGDLIDERLSFVILAPNQAERIRPTGTDEWQSVADGSIDPGTPYRYFHRDGSGRSIVLFFYDGPISRSIAFEGALSSSQALINHISQASCGEGRIVHIATDGESYGHHKKFGDRALAFALETEASKAGFRVTNYGDYLEEHVPGMEVEIKPGPNGEGTAWSCAHGVGRWIRDCGCSTGAGEDWSQAWRGPLRQALDRVRDDVGKAFEETRGRLFADPWKTRDAYIELILNPTRANEEWFNHQAGRTLSEQEREEALMHLEAQRNALLMYTSCGWFFADISGIETVQILKYADRVLHLMEELSLWSPREAFLSMLSEAKSNVESHGDGKKIFEKWVAPLRVTPARLASHLAISSLVEDGEESGEIARHRFRRSQFKRRKHGRLTIATGRIELEPLTGFRHHDFAMISMHLGGVDFYCALKPFPERESFESSATKIWSLYRTASLPTLLAMAKEEFGSEEYGLESLLPKGKDRISRLVFGDIVGNFTKQYIRLYESNQRAFEMLQEAGLELPKELLQAAEFTLGHRFEEEIRQARGSHDPNDYAKAVAISEEADRRGYRIDRSEASKLFAVLTAAMVSQVVEKPTDDAVENALAVLRVAKRLRLERCFDRSQIILDQALVRSPDLVSRLQILGSILGLKVRKEKEEA